MQRTKGASFERSIANAFKAVFPGARRGIGQTRAAREVPDVDGTPFWLECKHRRVVNIRAAMRQAVAETDGRPPAVVSRCNGETVLITLALDEFLELLRAAGPMNNDDLLRKAGVETRSD